MKFDPIKSFDLLTESYWRIMSTYNLKKASIGAHPGAETDNQIPKALVLLYEKNRFSWHSRWIEKWTHLDYHNMRLEKSVDCDPVKTKDKKSLFDLFESDELPCMLSDTESDSDDENKNGIEVETLLNFGKSSFQSNCIVLATYKNQLSISNEIHASLFEDLEKMAIDSKDYRQEIRTCDYRPIHYSTLQPVSKGRPEVEMVRWLARVCDIIDPSLNAHEFPTGNGKQTDQHWIPTDIEVNSQGQVKFTSEINNLDVSKYPKFQDYCSAIMTSMLPYFEAVTRQSLKSRKLQVIVKAQVYEVLPGGFYQGAFHSEGTHHEKIKAVGIYYVDIDSQLCGGNLELLRLDKGVGQNANVTTTAIAIQPKQCVIFANDHVYHRMTKLEHQTIDVNSQDDKEVNMGRRWILNFFLVDPNEKIQSSSAIPVNHRFRDPSQYDPVKANQKRQELRSSRVAYSKTNDPRSKEHYGGAD